MSRQCFYKIESLTFRSDIAGVANALLERSAERDRAKSQNELASSERRFGELRRVRYKYRDAQAATEKQTEERMDVRVAVLAIAMLVGVAPAATAASAVSQPTADYLNAACQAAPGTKDAAICSAYIDGFLQGALTFQTAKWPACPINKAFSGALRTRVAAELKSHPEFFKADFGSYVGSIFEAMYPCPR
jgi:hypothetical protein